MNDERLRLIGALLILISVFLPINFIVVVITGKEGFGNTTFYIHDWMFGLSYIIAEGDTVGQWFSFNFNLIGTIVMIIHIIFGIIILRSNNHDNGTRILALSIILLIFRIFSMIFFSRLMSDAIITETGSWITSYYPHIGSFSILIGCILAIVGSKKYVEGSI